MPTIAQPTPASGLLVRRPRCRVFVDGTPLPFVLGLSTTRGLDQDVGSADIVYPHPLPDFVRVWSKVQVLLGVDGPDDPDVPGQGLVERFDGYVLNVNDALWPGAHTIHCEDRLALAKYTYTPEEVDLSTFTDTAAVRRILGVPPTINQGGVGFAPGSMDIAGLNKLLVDFDDVAIKWEIGQTALEIIQAIDAQSLGFRTYCTASGRVLRRKISTDPATVGSVWHFQEGVDIIDGSTSKEIKDAKNEITVIGFDETVRATLPPDQDPFFWRRNSYWIRFLTLKATVPSTIISAVDVAAYILSQLNKNIVKVTFSTHLGMLFNGVEVVKITSPKLEVDQNFWVQSVQSTISDSGEYTQTLTCVSELADTVNRGVVPPPVVTPPTVPPGVPIAVRPIPPTPVAPSPDDVVPDFSQIAADQEVAVPAGLPPGTAGVTHAVALSDVSSSRQGHITGRQWDVTSPSGQAIIVPIGYDRTIVAAAHLPPGGRLDLMVTLTATDSNGQTNAVTRPAYDGTSPILARRLYAATDDTCEAFDGREWRSFTPGAAVKVVGAGPVWAGAGGLFVSSTDDLATDPTPATAPCGDVTAIWRHENDSRYVVLGGSGGALALTRDLGATFESRPGPGGAINFVISSIFNKSQWHVVTPSGWYKSEDEGATWAQVRAGSFRYLELAPGRNIVVTTAGVLQQAETGTPFTGNTAPIVAATAHIRQDTFYALADDGTTWYCPPGSFALTRGADLPGGATPAVAGAYRDGQVPDLVYFAASDGLYKTIDGFRTVDGYLRLRADGLLTP